MKTYWDDLVGLQRELLSGSFFYIARHQLQAHLDVLSRLPHAETLTVLLDALSFIQDEDGVTRSPHLARAEFILAALTRLFDRRGSSGLSDKTCLSVLMLMVQLGGNHLGRPDRRMAELLMKLDERQVRDHIPAILRWAAELKPERMLLEARGLILLTGEPAAVELMLSGYQQRRDLDDLFLLIWGAAGHADISHRLIQLIDDARLADGSGPHLRLPAGFKLGQEAAVDDDRFSDAIARCATLSRSPLKTTREVTDGEYEGYSYDSLTPHGEELMTLARCLNGIIYFSSGERRAGLAQMLTERRLYDESVAVVSGGDQLSVTTRSVREMMVEESRC